MVHCSSQKEISFNQCPYYMFCEGRKWVVGRGRKESLRRFNKAFWWGQRSFHELYMSAERGGRTDILALVDQGSLWVELACWLWWVCSFTALIQRGFSFLFNAFFFLQCSTSPWDIAGLIASLYSLALTYSVRLMFTAWVVIVWRNESIVLRFLWCVEQRWFI